jgi:hypothetical protein
MKKTLFTLVLLVVASASVFAQKKKLYSTSGYEMIFSGAKIDNQGNESGGVVRFAPAFNFTHQLNYEPIKGFGMFAGLGLKNLGFIYDLPNSNERKKYRTYALSIPAGITLGHRNDTFFFLGYQLDAPFHYKEKTFVDNNLISKNTAWLTKRNPELLHAVFVGFSPADGAEFKVAYYMNNFFNKDFQAESGTTAYNFDVNLITFSVSWTLFRSGNFVW